MGLAILKVIVAASLISLVSWLSGKKLALAGFLTALPLTTMLALAFTHWEWNNPKLSVDFAKSVFAAVPLSLLFFVPFLLANRFQLGFWTCYSAGIVLLGIGYLIHSQLTSLMS